MTWHLPEPWEALVLALAIYRATRIIGWDSITNWPRMRLTHLPEREGEVYVGPGHDKPRYKLHEFVKCPFCTGWWLSIATMIAYWAWPDATLAVAAVFALSAAAGLIAKRLDP